MKPNRRRVPRKIAGAIAAELQAVTFDVGGTLIECWPSVGHVYAEVAALHGFAGIDPHALNRRFGVAWSNLRDFRHTREEWAALVDETFGDLVGPGGTQSFFGALYERFAQPGAWRVFEDVVPTLTALKSRGFKLGLISNWDERLRPLLRKLGLYDYFDVITVSCEVALPKPSPAIFAQIAQIMALAPDQILHIGDSLVSDVQGARCAGFQALWLRRGRPRAGTGEIRSLRELVEAPC